MASEAQQSKAAAYLAEQRLRVLRADEHTAQFKVKGTEPQPYAVGYNGTFWTCTCASRKEECAHVLAAKAVYPTTPDAHVLSAKSDPEIDALLA